MPFIIHFDGCYKQRVVAHMETTAQGWDAADETPPQYQPQSLFDLRASKTGPRGFKCRNKRKLDDYDEQAQQEQATVNAEEAAEEGASIQTRKKTKHDTVGVGKVSGRPWKVPGERAGSLKSAVLSTTWEKKMALKAERQSFVSHKREVVTARKEKLAAARRQREAAKKRKEENRRKSTITQKVTNPAKLKKLLKGKKSRKRIITGDA